MVLIAMLIDTENEFKMYITIYKYDLAALLIMPVWLKSMHWSLKVLILAATSILISINIINVIISSMR